MTLARDAAGSLGGLVCFACTTTVAPSADQTTVGATTPAVVETSDAASSCEPVAGLAPERVELSVNGTSTIASGLVVHFVGTTIDHYEDGSFDILAELRFRWGETETGEIVSALAPTEPPVFRGALDHCWRLVEAGETGVVVEVTPSAAAATSLEACGEASKLPVLASDYDVADGARFQAVIRYDLSAHAWVVEPPPKVVLHHATRIDWSNLASFGRAGLGLARGRDVRVTFRFESSEVTPVPEHQMWLSEYIAELESACLP